MFIYFRSSRYFFSQSRGNTRISPPFPSITVRFISGFIHFYHSLTSSTGEFYSSIFRNTHTTLLFHYSQRRLRFHLLFSSRHFQIYNLVSITFIPTVWCISFPLLPSENSYRSTRTFQLWYAFQNMYTYTLILRETMRTYIIFFFSVNLVHLLKKMVRQKSNEKYRIRNELKKKIFLSKQLFLTRVCSIFS